MAKKDAVTMAPSSRSNPFDSIPKWDYASHPSRSPPRTPPLRASRAAAKGKGPGRAPRSRPALHDTFFDDGNARGSKSTRPSTNKRDSHDLSWSPKQTRDSVVDNMLLSLDQLFVGGGGGSPSRGSNNAVYSGIDENYSVAPHRDIGRQRGHTFSSSLSSDYDMSLAELTTDYQNRSPRRHRPHHSGSNLQSGLQRIDSVYVDDDYSKGIDEKFLETGRATISGDRAGRPRHSGRKGSKSSGSSSLDFGHTLSGPRWQRSVERHSSSFDHGYEKKQGALPLTINTYSHSPSISRPQFDYNDFDEAAPTPTVPAGPRRNRSPPPAMFGPGIPYAPQMPPSTSSNNTLRRKSSLTYSGKHQNRLAKAEKPARTSNKQSIKYGRSHILEDADDASVIAAFADGLVASPAVPMFKSSETTLRSTSIAARERPGFFKRVFGSSWSSTPSPKAAPALQPVPISSRNSVRSESRNVQATPAPLVSRHSRSQGSGNMSNATKDLPPLPLNKKSSFFRRRKKSVSGEMPLPPLPPQIQTELQGPVKAVQEIEPSPVSSLREVMKPFLNRPSSSQLLDKELESGDLGIHDVAYLAGYAARNESSRKPFIDLHRRTDSDPAFVDGGPNDLTLPEREDSQAKVDPNLNLHAPHESSYLHDSSSANESVDDQQIFKAKLVAEDVQSSHQPSSPSSKVENDASVLHTDNELPTAKPTISDGKAVALDEHIPVKQMPLEVVNSNASNAETTLTTPRKPEPKFIATPERVSSKRHSASLPNSPTQRGSRLWLDTISATDITEKPKQPLTPKYTVSNSARQSIATIEDFKSASSQLASPVNETPNTQDVPAQTLAEDTTGVREEAPTEAMVEAPSTEILDEALDAPEFDSILPTEHDRLLAKQIFEGTNEEIKPRAAPWLGDVGAERARVRRAYMELFDWQNLNILAGLRALCNRLFLKGETQQIDRILTAFSTRWCECNPNHGFKATDVVHTICYSILLLNTDLHMADIDSKMTRVQFIRNTMPSIRRVAADAAPDAFDTGRASIVPPLRGAIYNAEPSTPIDGSEKRPSLENKRPIYRLSTRPSDHSGLDTTSVPSTPLDYDPPLDDCGPLVKTPFYGRLSTWEVQIEIVLKDFYNCIRQQRLPVQGDEVDGAPESIYQASVISGIANNILRRTGSTLSKTGSESNTMRGRFNELRTGPASRWSSKNRSRPRLLQSSTMPSSSRTSLDDGSSIMSPSASSTWSRYSYGKTQTSMSVDSFASSFPKGDYKQSIGFANALSQAIIREEAAANSTNDEITAVAPLLEDESLELAGAPWAKEGILKHKHHLESVDKKAKDRNWTECFAVVEKGWMQLFSFNMNAKSMRQKAKSQKAAGGVVGGGNWAENAEPIGKYLLRQTIASALPPPGYSKARPHVWALSLPTGAVHLFQVGTPEIVKEFVSTANYWSARLSKEPLVGGVSNMEYGWSEHVINFALLPANENTRAPSNANAGPRPSLQSSIRSSIDHPGSNTKPRLPGDRIIISDWTPPQQSMLPSALMEVDQLKGLSTYVKNIEEELQRHNELRSAMLLTFSPRHPNHTKAMTNWERKSAYLLREIVKFRTYIDSLQAAQVQKEKLLALKEVRKEGQGEVAVNQE
ncbi:MAG: hypothetical protein MMC33_006219 [Icmadophila ericetorum]|nr:hypothetical protein [Icmadophila ericetorum]